MAWYEYLSPAYDLNKLSGAIGGPSIGNGDLYSGLSSLKPSQADTDPLVAAQKNSLDLQNQFGGKADAFSQQYLPQSSAALAINGAVQNANMAMLQKYASGEAPSAAEMLLRQQGAANAANAYGAAAALGSRTPGSNLNAALRAAQTANATANQQAAAARANEQQSATSALSQAIGQQQQGALTQQGQNLNYLGGLQQNQLNAGGQIANAAGAQVNANEQNAQTKNSYYGGIIGGAGQALGSLAKLSDEREKTNVQPTSGGAFDKLADALKGFTFDYKHPGVEGETPGPQFGFMAQDAQKGGKPGQAMVRKGTDGLLRIDTGNALTAALAMSAEALRRTKKGGGGAPPAAMAA